MTASARRWARRFRWPRPCARIFQTWKKSRLPLAIMVASSPSLYSYFYVVPKDLSIPDWQTMKNELESAISGLAMDFVRRELIKDRKSTRLNSSHQLSSYAG